MKHIKTLLFALPLFALAITGCVKYNGRESSNPVDKARVTISQTSLKLEQGKTAQLTASVNKEGLDIYWESGNEDVVTLSPKEGTTVTVNAAAQGKTTVSAFVNYKDKKYSAACNVTVEHKTAPEPIGPGDDPSTPTDDEEVTTYLVIGKNGRYNGEAGSDFASLYLEYTVAFKAKPGEALPTADEVTTTVTGSTFRYWQAYDGGGALTKYEKVPNVRGKILYAYFSGGSGEVEPGPGPEPEPTGSITLYFEFGANMNWSSPADEKVYLGTNNSPTTFVSAAKQSDGNYKATVNFSGSVSCVNAYINQGGDSGKYFHPTTGVKDYNKMNSAVSIGKVSVVDGGTYTITMTDWDYGMPDNAEWTDGWFKYTFAEGAPSGGSVTPPDPGSKFTLIFAGIEEWQDATGVHFIVNGTQHDATKQSNGKYTVEVTFEAVTKLQCYMSQTGKFFHPYNGSYDKMNSDINMGSVTIEANKSYVVTFNDWHKEGGEAHWDTENGTQHGWFDYTFALAA